MTKIFHSILFSLYDMRLCFVSRIFFGLYAKTFRFRVSSSEILKYFFGIFQFPLLVFSGPGYLHFSHHARIICSDTQIISAASVGQYYSSVSFSLGTDTPAPSSEICPFSISYCQRQIKKPAFPLIRMRAFEILLI